MADKPNESFYINLSRKELQSLCKKHGLPANKSKSYLASSLAAYFEEGFGGSMYNPVFQCDWGALMNKEVPEKCFGNHLDFAKDGTGINGPQDGNVATEVGVLPSEKCLPSSWETSNKVHSFSFEFHVRSDEGINLCVDFDSSPSDWANRFKNDICVCENACGNKSRSLRQDLGPLGERDKLRKSLSLWNVDADQINHNEEQMKSSPYLKLTKDLMGLDQQNKHDSCLIPASLMACSLTMDATENLEEDQSITTAEANDNAVNHLVSVTESSAKDGSRIPFNSNIISIPLINSACDSVGNSVSDPVSLRHQNSKLDDEACENLTQLNSCKYVNHSTAHNGGSISGSLEIQISEVASCQKYEPESLYENDRFLDLIDTKRGLDTECDRLVNACELNQENDQIHFPLHVEEREAAKISNARESLKCPQYDDNQMKEGLSSKDMESKDLCKKRKHVGMEEPKADRKPVGMLLRSMKQNVPRRSMRLISK